MCHECSASQYATQYTVCFLLLFPFVAGAVARYRQRPESPSGRDTTSSRSSVTRMTHRPWASYWLCKLAWDPGDMQHLAAWRRRGTAATAMRSCDQLVLHCLLGRVLVWAASLRDCAAALGARGLASLGNGGCGGPDRLPAGARDAPGAPGGRGTALQEALSAPDPLKPGFDNPALSTRCPCSCSSQTGTQTRQRRL